MKKWKRTIIGPDTSILDTMKMLNEVGQSIAVVIDEEWHLLGVVTDGDIRRGILAGKSLDTPINLVMNSHPFVASVSDEREEIMKVMAVRGLRHIPLVDNDAKVVGLIALDEALSNQELPNWAVVMAGGLGSRLHPLTEHYPKPLLNVGARPILETIIFHLKKSGFKKIMLSVNYKAEMIMSYFGDGSKHDVNIEYIIEEKPLGTAGALGLINKDHALLKRPFLLMNGDVLTEMDFSRVVHFNDNEASLATMCVREYFHEIPYGVVHLDDHKLVSLEEKPIHSFFINAGIYVLSPEILGYIDSGERCDITDVLNHALMDQKKITAYPITEYWRDVGTHDDFNQAEQDYDMVFGRTEK